MPPRRLQKWKAGAIVHQQRTKEKEEQIAESAFYRAQVSGIFFSAKENLPIFTTASETL
jgi:hypothetical protein